MSTSIPFNSASISSTIALFRTPQYNFPFPGKALIIERTAVMPTPPAMQTMFAYEEKSGRERYAPSTRTRMLEWFRSFAVVPERVRTINVKPVSGGVEDSIPDILESEMLSRFGRMDTSGFTSTVSANFSPLAITDEEVAPKVEKIAPEACEDIHSVYNPTDDNGRPMAICLFDTKETRPRDIWCLAVIETRGLLLEYLPEQDVYQPVGFYMTSSITWMSEAPVHTATIV